MHGIKTSTLFWILGHFITNEALSVAPNSEIRKAFTTSTVLRNSVSPSTVFVPFFLAICHIFGKINPDK